MQYTNKLGLKKPDLTDYVQISDLNENMDILDTEIAKITDEETGVEAKLTQHLDDNTRHNSYGTSSTAASTVAKVVSRSGFVLGTGAHVAVKFTNGNTAANPTINVNGTGAKPIYQNGTAGATWSAGEVVEFVYDGTNYHAFATGKDAIDHINNKNNPHAVTSDQVNRLAVNAFAESASIWEYPLGESVMYVQNSKNSWIGKTGSFFVIETYRTTNGWGTQRATYHGNTGTYEVFQRSVGTNTSGVPWGPWISLITENGGEMQGILKAANNTSYTISQVRNVRFGTTEPTGPLGGNGDIYFQYE